MRYKKVIIDGKEYLEIINDDENNAEGETVNADLEDDRELSGSERFKRDAGEFFAKVGEGAKNIGIKIGVGAKSFGTRVARDAKEAGRKIKEGAERLFAKDKTLDPESKEARLIKLLPFMAKDEVKEVAEKIISDDATLRTISLSLVMPYFEREYCNMIFKRCIELERDNLDIPELMQYVDSSVLSEIVDEYLEGKHPKLAIDELYPFLPDEDIKRIFYHISGE